MTAFVETRHLPSMRLLGITGDFVGLMGAKPNGDDAIPAIWERLFDQLELVDEFEFGWAVGVMVPSRAPNAVEGQMEYFAGLVIDEAPEEYPGLELRSLDACDYVVCEHLGSLDELAESTKWFYSEYLPGSDFTMKNAPHLEVYDERFDPESDQSVVMICAPIQ